MCVCVCVEKGEVGTKERVHGARFQTEMGLRALCVLRREKKRVQKKECIKQVECTR